MKAGLLRRIAAAALGLAVILPATTQPAQAADNSPYLPVVEVLGTVLGMAEDGSLSPAEALELLNLLRSAVNGVKVDLLSRLDAELVNEIKAETDAAIAGVPFLTIPAFAGPYLVSVHNAAFHAKSHLDTVSADSDLDTVGRAIITLFTILDVGYEKGGVPNRVQRYADHRQALQKIVDRLAPHCESQRFPNAGLAWATCTFNGKTVRGEQSVGPDGLQVSVNGGTPVPGVLSEEMIGDLVMVDTAETLAKLAMEQLARRGY